MAKYVMHGNHECYIQIVYAKSETMPSQPIACSLKCLHGTVI